MRSPRSRKRFRRKRSELTVKQILTWADAYYERKGKWPEIKSGRVWETAFEKWGNINQALHRGSRGLHRGSSLARLLAKHRGKRNRKALPKYTSGQILGWADAHYARFGKWPHRNSGAIADAPGETWMAIQAALHAGIRGLSGGSSLAKLLSKKRGVPNFKDMPHLSFRRILTWADTHHRRTGSWPMRNSGPIVGSRGDTWMIIDAALRKGRRGLRKGSSLLKLLATYRGVNFRIRKPCLSVDAILAWADAHRARTGTWPQSKSGQVHGTPGETWSGIEHALHLGTRGLSGGTTLARLLEAKRQARNLAHLPQLSERQILAWARRYRRTHGKWPNQESGTISDAPGETWAGVNYALRSGSRGLPRRTTLAQLIAGFHAQPGSQLKVRRTDRQ